MLSLEGFYQEWRAGERMTKDRKIGAGRDMEG